MAKNLRRNKEKKRQDILLSEGILLSGVSAGQREGRWMNLFVRAIFLFALVTGSLGGMLSAFHISYAKWAFFVTTLLAALYCASLYSAVWWENVGYILIFLLVLNAGVGLRTYISSGFYGILNDISSAASLFFESDAQVSYAEQIEDHSLAISVAMCYFALVGCVITNGLISRKTKYLKVLVPAVFFLLVPIYLEYEPSGGYVILLAVGIITVYVLRQNHYSCQRPKANALEKAAKKHTLAGTFSGRAIMGTLLAVALLCSVIVGMAGLFLPRSSYMKGNTRSALKIQTMDRMENFYLLGVMGLMNFYQNTGGLVNGRLGGVNSVRLDYETDLTLEFVPYTYDRIYLKTFVGAEYIPYENHWSIEDETAYAEGWNTDTAARLEDAFLADSDRFARGIMNIRNVAAPIGVYLPYYSYDTEKVILPGMEQKYTFYPLLTEQPAGSAEPLTSELWLSVPEANREEIAGFCAEAGLTGSREEIIDTLRAYFQEEFPYTLSPGITPWRKDFVNYFLTEKRKGYCAHYASSATLILRYMGIPARYVEGYAVDAIDIASDAERTDYEAADYYKGASMLPPSSVISYDASDGNSHAWVEIYDEKIGWYPIELTPYRTDMEEDRTSLWDMFTRLFQTGSGTESAKEDTQDTAGTTLADTLRTSAHRLLLCLALLLLVIPVWFLIQKSLFLCRYRRADRSERLLIQYRSMIRQASGKSAQSRELLHKKNFEEQIAWLAGHGILTAEVFSPERLIQILNEAAFSAREISIEAYEEAQGMIQR